MIKTKAEAQSSTAYVCNDFLREEFLESVVGTFEFEGEKAAAFATALHDESRISQDAWTAGFETLQKASL